MSEPSMGGGPGGSAPDPWGSGPARPPPPPPPDEGVPPGELRRVIVGLLALSMLSAGLCAAVVLYLRGGRAAAPTGRATPAAVSSAAAPAMTGQATMPAATMSAATTPAAAVAPAAPGSAAPEASASAAPEASSSAAPAVSVGSSSQPGTVRAVVSLRPGRPKAIIRDRPAFGSRVVLVVPSGTEVDVTNTRIIKSQTWCRVRTVGLEPETSGWMAADVLKMD